MATIIGMDGKEVKDGNRISPDTISPKRIYDEAELAGLTHVMVIGVDSQGTFHACSNIDGIALKTHLLELAKYLNVKEDLEGFE